MNNIINVNNISYEYITEESSYKAIDNLSLDVKQGEFVAIIGHNGSGKSTLSKNLNAILMPTEGNILIDGNDTKDEEKLWDIRQTAGMVFQNPDNQIVATVVEEDVAFGPENLGIEPQLIRQRVKEALEKGFNMYPDFPNPEVVYKNNVLEVFAQRLTNTERSDIQKYYNGRMGTN